MLKGKDGKDIKMKAFRYVRMTIGLLALITVSCATTKLSHVWTDESMAGESVGDILVLAVTDETAIRRSYESKFVDRLRRSGLR